MTGSPGVKPLKTIPRMTCQNVDGYDFARAFIGIGTEGRYGEPQW